MKTPSSKTLLPHLLAVLLAAIASPTSAAIFVKIPNVPGDVRAKGYDDGSWFEVKSGSYGKRSKLDESGPYLSEHHSVGTGNLKQLGIALHTGPQTAPLLQAAIDGSSLGDVEIHLVDIHDGQDDQTVGFTFGIVRLGSVNVSSFETKSFHGERPYYQAFLSYRTIEMTTRHEVPVPEGVETHESVSHWDLATNTGTYQDRVLPPEENPNLNPYSFQSWRNVAFTPDELENPEISGPLADWDKDGLNTLLEYKLGKDPRDPSDGSSDIVLSKNPDPSAFMELTFVQRPDESDPAVLLFVEGSQTLKDWHSGPDTVELVSKTPLDDEFELVKVRATKPIADMPSFFFRFRVEEQENE